MASFDLAEIARQRDAFTTLVMRHVDAMPARIELHITPDGIAVPGLARLDMAPGSGKTTTALALISRLARGSRQVLVVAPTVVETIEVARRLRAVASTAMVSCGVDVVDGDDARQVLVAPRTTARPGPASGYISLRRSVPELFAVAHNRRPVWSMDVSSHPLSRPIRRLLAGLDPRCGSMAKTLESAARRLLHGAYARLERAASTPRHVQTDAPLGVPVPLRPQVTRGPTAPWTNSALSVRGELAHT